MCQDCENYTTNCMRCVKNLLTNRQTNMRTRINSRQGSKRSRYVNKVRRALHHRVASWSAGNTDDEASEDRVAEETVDVTVAKASDNSQVAKENNNVKVVEENNNEYDSDAINEADVEIFRKSLKEVAAKKQDRKRQKRLSKSRELQCSSEESASLSLAHEDPVVPRYVRVREGDLDATIVHVTKDEDLPASPKSVDNSEKLVESSDLPAPKKPDDKSAKNSSPASS